MKLPSVAATAGISMVTAAVAIHVHMHPFLQLACAYGLILVLGYVRPDE
jgi:hypothetical protein